MNYSNFHTHSLHCDGKHGVDEIVREAIGLGCPQLGFSSHSPDSMQLPPPPSFAHTERARMLAYKKEVEAAKERYGDRIRLYCGVEQEYYSNTPVNDYEYVIGSAHFVKKNQDYIPVDRSAEDISEGAKKHYDGDVMEFVRDYYRIVADIPRRFSCQIVGHLDLVTKFQEKTPLFDDKKNEYRVLALEALQSLSQHKLVFELNSGAVSRGYRSDCYPAPFLLDALAQLHLPVVLSSDAHSKEHLLYGFEKMSELAKAHKLTVFSSMDQIISYCR